MNVQIDGGKPVKKRKGFLNPARVRAFTFYTVTACIALSVAACILAIWDFAEGDVLWRTIATLGVVALGVILFSMVNSWFDHEV